MADPSGNAELRLLLPAATLRLGGFILAHAVWSVSDNDADELLCPLAVMEQNGERELLRFEAETQEDAIRHGMEHLNADTCVSDALAFAREGVVNQSGYSGDVIAVDLRAKGVEKTMTLIQRFRRACESSGFQLVGQPTVVVDGYVQGSEAAAKEVLRSVRDGITEHGPVGPLWNAWKGW